MKKERVKEEEREKNKILNVEVWWQVPNYIDGWLYCKNVLFVLLKIVSKYLKWNSNVGRIEKEYWTPNSAWIQWKMTNIGANKVWIIVKLLDNESISV